MIPLPPFFMKSFVFRTKNNNYYLYSSGIKKFIPIPEKTYYNFIEKKPDDLLNTFYQSGFLQESNIKITRKVEATDVEYAFINIPQIVFEVTTKCNFKCKYCCYGECYETFARRKEGILKFESAKILLDTISQLSFSNKNTTVNTPLVLSFYGGEPLLNFPLIKEIVEYSKTLNFKGRFLRYSLTTNASLLTKYIDYLQANDFSLLISLDGNEENNKYRMLSSGVSSYDLVIKNLNYVEKKYPDYFKTIRFNSVFTNLTDLESLLSYFENRFKKSPTISPLHFSDGDKVCEELKSMMKKIPLVDSHFLLKYPDAFLEIPIHKKIIHLLLYMTDSLYYNEMSFIHSIEIPEEFPTHTCIPFTKRLFLTVDNKIVPCEKVNRDNPLGEIREGKILLNYEYIADRFNKQTSKYLNLCPNCALQNICNHCAFTSTQYKGCPEFKTMESLGKICEEIFSYMENNPNVLDSIFENIILK